ncbi:uncharacterized protein LOC111627234 [Centruroides sculpturatus]|uniref:uncharacterized protein LOC111627234 n=1 Tax=Centruroides sculpturatus TaxID=218467 RepID=UPI000C6E5E4B|nr:uncharacterized protein LOC111627234 [Centruroides sculpturatus]
MGGLETMLGERYSLIKQIVDHKFAPSLLLYGPPGVGKTTLALALARELKLTYHVFNSALDKKHALEKIIQASREKQMSILIVEEIHRINRDRQDIILQALDQEKLLLFATTTENPFFVVNPALRSRVQIIEVHPLGWQQILRVLKTAVQKIAAVQKIQFADQALELVAKASNGDLRYALKTIELAARLFPKKRLINPATMAGIFNSTHLTGAHYGDQHYDLLSAYQKSVRGSDVDASLYYLARLLANGDHQALMRRMLVTAYEDIGLANPIIAVKVKTATDCFRQLGLPEGMIPLGLVTIEMALSEKSNSGYLAIKKAYQVVTKGGQAHSVPIHLRDAHYKSAAKLGHGQGYLYPHNFPSHFTEQSYLPKELLEKRFFQIDRSNLYERKLAELYERFTKKTKS